MSILKKLGAALLLAAISLPMWAAPATANATGEITIKTKAVDSKSIAIYLYNLDKEKTTLQVRDRHGNVYFQKRINHHNGFSMLLDLEQLPAGSYIIQVNRKDGASSQVVRVMEEGLLLSQIVEKE
ncbi:MAG: T9SS type A sorting domain-containing protein [Lewinellaceae bacterium]|nr:T9SS type A sorting domain-containing protein [Phaeodactylibacter sp.]MCB9346037.1 T9SS type A sorting domain-containing protein [Lewinellaceae bacterium]